MLLCQSSVLSLSQRVKSYQIFFIHATTFLKVTSQPLLLRTQQIERMERILIFALRIYGH